MTEHDTTAHNPTGPNVSDELAPVVPEGCDPLDDLTAGELGHIGKLLSCDPYDAVKNPATGLRWPAFAHLAWVWAKRTDPTAKLAPYMDRKPTELQTLLGMDRDDPAEGAEQGAEENPTDSTPAS